MQLHILNSIYFRAKNLNEASITYESYPKSTKNMECYSPVRPNLVMYKQNWERNPFCMTLLIWILKNNVKHAIIVPIKSKFTIKEPSKTLKLKDI